MRTQRILSLLDGIVAWPVLLIAFVTQLVLGLLFLIPIVDALFLLLVSLIFVVAFFGPLLALSWLWLWVPLLRLPVAILGIPWALVGNKFSVLIPVPPTELDSRTSKLLFTVLWPYSWIWWQFQAGRLDSEGQLLVKEFWFVVDRETRNVPPQRDFVQRVLKSRMAPAVDETAETVSDELDSDEMPVDLIAALRDSVARAKEHKQQP